MLSLPKIRKIIYEIEPTVDILDNNRINLTYNIEESDIVEFQKL